MSHPRSRSEVVIARLRHRRGEHELEPGSYVIGRHKSCNIVLDSKHVSRRHARLDVSRTGILLTDLGSANGLWVNGVRVSDEPVWLHSGDRVLLGEEELVIVADSYRPLSQKLERVVLPQTRLTVKDDDDLELSDGERSSPGTRRTNFFDLVGAIVERAVAEGRFDDAATMLQSQLTKTASDARAGRPVPADTRDGALKFSMLLAAATSSPRWLEYVVDLLAALRWVPDPAVSRSIEKLFDSIDGVSPTSIAAYVASLEKLADPVDRLRATHWARGLTQAASRRK